MAPELLYFGDESVDVDDLILKHNKEKLNGMPERILYCYAMFVLNHCHFTLPKGKQADVYALAIVFSELADPKVPENFRYRGLRMSKDSRPVLPPSLIPRVSELIRRMWDTSPSTRPVCKDILITLRMPAELAVSEDEVYPWYTTTTVTMRQQPSVNMNTDDSNTSSSAD
jgi:hypothetical protein